MLPRNVVGVEWVVLVSAACGSVVLVSAACGSVLLASVVVMSVVVMQRLSGIAPPGWVGAVVLAGLAVASLGVIMDGTDIAITAGAAATAGGAIPLLLE